MKGKDLLRTDGKSRFQLLELDLAEAQLTSERYYQEARETAKEAVEAVRDAKAKIATLTAKLPKAAQGVIEQELRALEMKLNDHMPWIVQQHHEHMTKAANNAKLEIEAYLVRATERVGLNEAEKLPMLESMGSTDEA